MAKLNTKELDEFSKRLGGLPKQLHTIVEKSVTQVLMIYQGQVRAYPPQPDRMRSGHINRYRRGIGYVSAKGKTTATSQRLGTSWSIATKFESMRFTGTLGTKVSYAPFVQGDAQTPYHALTGWPTLKGVVENSRGERDEVLKTIGAGIAEYLRTGK